MHFMPNYSMSIIYYIQLCIQFVYSLHCTSDSSLPLQKHIKDKDEQLVRSFTVELQQVLSMFHEKVISPPTHYNMPPIVCRLMWVVALKKRIMVSIWGSRCITVININTGSPLRFQFLRVLGTHVDILIKIFLLIKCVQTRFFLCVCMGRRIARSEKP